MKHLILIAITLMTSLYCYSQTGIIKGHLYNNINEDVATVLAGIYLIDQKIGTSTDFDGNFILESVPVGVYDILVYNQGYMDTILNSIKVTEDSVVTLSIKYPPECVTSKKNKICPVCGRSDKVIPIIYGQPLKAMVKKARKGEIRLGGCFLHYCNPYWYCKRDKKKF